MKTQRALLCCAILASVVCTAGCVTTQVAQQPSPDTSTTKIPQWNPAEEELIRRDQPVVETTCPWQLQVERQMYPQVLSAEDREEAVY